MVALPHLLETTPKDDALNRLTAPGGAEEPETLSEYLLVCEAIAASDTVGSWRFSLETAAGTTLLDVREKEFGNPNRLALWAIVRGLEAIEGAASVTLISTSRYAIRGLRDSLHRWRENGFMWEHFGRTVPVENADLWRRVDHALRFHLVHACLVSATKVCRHVDAPARPTAGNRAAAAGNPAGAAGSQRGAASRPFAGGATSTDGAARSFPSPTPPADRLRRWLLSQCGSEGPKRKYGPADLALA